MKDKRIGVFEKVEETKFCYLFIFQQSNSCSKFCDDSKEFSLVFFDMRDWIIFAINLA